MPSAAIRLERGHISLQSLAASGEPRMLTAQLVRAGRVRYADNSPGPFTIPEGALLDGLSRGLFAGLSCFIDHPSFFDSPSLRNLAGRVTRSWYDLDAQAIAATIRLLDNPAGDLIASIAADLLGAQQTGEPVPDVGLSLVFWPAWEPADESDVLVLRRFRHIESADFVFQPATDSRVIEALQALAPDAYPTEQPFERSAEMPPETTETYTVDEASVQEHDGQQPVLSDAPTPLGSDPSLATETSMTALLQDLRQLQQEVLAMRADHARARADRVVQIGDTPPRGSGRVSLGRTSLEQVTAALEALIAGTMPPAGVQPLSGLRELYHLLSGDYELHGVFQPDRVYLANVNSSTMAGIVANALNKRLINAFQTYPRWWEPLCTVQDFSNLQQIKWITLGGIGELPTVAEGAAYTELTWDDQTETADFVKKGGYVGLTIEAIDKDDVGALRAAPRALAQAAWLTLSKSVSDIFTTASGTGPTMSDGVVLFHAASHSNLRTTGLSWTEWIAVRSAMQKQTELNSGERLGALTSPRYLIVPIDLEITALQILASEGEPGTGDNDVNPLSSGDSHNARLGAARERVIVCPLWTDTNNWAAAADPNLYPVIGLGFRYGRVPEIFSVASPTAGLMFTNDTMPIKVRFFYAVGPTDWRGLHKNNVADPG